MDEQFRQMLLRQIAIFLFFVIGVVVLVCVCIFTLLYVQTRKQYGQRIARQQMRIAGIVLALLVPSTILLIYLGVQYVGSPSWLYLLLIGFSIGALGIIPVAFVRDRRAGAVLLDLGPVPNHRMFLVLGGFWFVMALVTVLTEVRYRGLELDSAANLLMRLACGVLLSVAALRRVQIRERGIWYGALIAWSTIQAYDWEAGKPGILNISIPSRSRFARELNIPIPPRLRSDVETLLAEHVPPVSTLRQNPAT